MLASWIHQRDIQSKGWRETSTSESQDMQGIRRAPGSSETSTRAGNSLHPAQPTVTQHGQKGWSPAVSPQDNWLCSRPLGIPPWKQARFDWKTSVNYNATQVMLNGKNKRPKHLQHLQWGLATSHILNYGKNHYCFLKFFCSKIKKSVTTGSEAFIQGLVTLASSPSSLWSQLLPVVELVWLSGLGGS